MNFSEAKIEEEAFKNTWGAHLIACQGCEEKKKKTKRDNNEINKETVNGDRGFGYEFVI